MTTHSWEPRNNDALMNVASTGCWILCISSESCHLMTWCTTPSAERCPDDTLSAPYRVLTNLTDFTGLDPTFYLIRWGLWRRSVEGILNFVSLSYITTHVSHLIKYTSTLLRTSRVTALKIDLQLLMNCALPCAASKVYILYVGFMIFKACKFCEFLSEFPGWACMRWVEGAKTNEGLIITALVTDPPGSR